METAGSANDPLTAVRETAEWVCQQSQHVSISVPDVEQVAQQLTAPEVARLSSPHAFDAEAHYVDGGDATAQYLLVVDALNFCFWPEAGLEYEHLARGVKAALLRDGHALDAEVLAAMDGPGVQRLLGWQREVPLQEERARLLREVGAALQAHFGGQAAELVRAARGSAAALVGLVTQHLPGFRDHAVYRGRQVFLYKRAQIFVGDLWGAFQGRGLGAFHDIHRLTMFADYRVPVVLRSMGILRYSPDLASKVDTKQELWPGSAEEVEIRACTIAAVEMLQQRLRERFCSCTSPLGGNPVASAGQLLAPEAPGSPPAASAAAPAAEAQQAGSHPEGLVQTGDALAVGGVVLPHSVQLDWWLWEQGEASRTTDPPHHRVLTIFY